jgi:hypothetical protein
MHRSSLLRLRLHARAGRRTQGWLTVGSLTIPVALGRGGIRANKREGDGGTPRGKFHLMRLWWRADRHPRPPTLLPVRPITGNLAWCEDPRDRRYNQPFRRAADESGDRLWRDDRLYDFIIEIDHNTRLATDRRLRGDEPAAIALAARPGGAQNARGHRVIQMLVQYLTAQHEPMARPIRGGPAPRIHSQAGSPRKQSMTPRFDGCASQTEITVILQHLTAQHRR